MIHELKNILYQFDENKETITKMEPYVEKSKELATHKQTLESLETGKTASIWLIPIEYAEAEKYGFIRKYITHRRRYREYVNSVRARDRSIQRMKNDEQEAIDKLSKEIGEAKEKYGIKQDVVSYVKYLKANVKEAENKKTPKDMGLNIYQVAEILNKNGVPLVLTEEDKIPVKDYRDLKSLDDFVCVYKSNLAPVGDEIMVDCSHNSNVENEAPCEDSKPTYRDSIYFTLNGVREDLSEDQSLDCKYVVYIKAPELLKQGNISNVSICNMQKQGNVNISKGAFMICPKEEVDEQNAKNPSLFVVGYDGNNASGFDQCFVPILGYSLRDTIDDVDEEDTEAFKKLIKNSGIAFENSQN